MLRAVTSQRGTPAFNPVLHGARLAMKSWCVPSLASRWSPETVFTNGADVGVLLDDGRVLVGRVTRELGSAHLLALRLWGRTEATCIPRSSVVSARLVGEHSWADRQDVVKRQRRGEPAFVPAAHDGPPDPDE